MRNLTVAAAVLMLAACHKPDGGQDGGQDGAQGDFRPPTVQLRGDIVPRQESRFARLDQDGDGFIAQDELPRRRPERTAALDVDHDGKVSKSEFVEGAIKRFDTMDANHDGQVTPEERRAARGGA